MTDNRYMNIVLRKKYARVEKFLSVALTGGICFITIGVVYIVAMCMLILK